MSRMTRVALCLKKSVELKLDQKIIRRSLQCNGIHNIGPIVVTCVRKVAMLPPFATRTSQAMLHQNRCMLCTVDVLLVEASSVVDRRFIKPGGIG